MIIHAKFLKAKKKLIFSLTHYFTLPLEHYSKKIFFVNAAYFKDIMCYISGRDTLRNEKSRKKIVLSR
jgi:hypothetical protein